MSNPQTFYTVGGLDLSNIFQPLSLGSSTLVTGYKFGNSHADLNTIFAAYPGSGPQASATGYKVGVNDLNTIFAKYNNNVFPITNSLLTSSTTYSNFIMPSGKTKFNFSFCGSGGSGYTTSSTTYGGGGSGGWIQALNIPYLLNTNYITSIGITMGNRSDTVVTVNYSNNTTIILTAETGVSTFSDSGNTGGAGGVCSITTNNTTWISSGNYTSVAGVKGGNYNASGTSSGKTTSGSGANSTSTAVNSINPAGPPSSFSLGSITVTSQGGGRSPTITSGYGCGGASTPSGYTGTGGAGEYRYATSGCCIINLT